MFKIKILSLFLSFIIFFNIPSYAQEFTDVDEETEEIEEDDESQYEDYEEEGSIQTEATDLNDRVKYFDIAGIMIGQTYSEVKDKIKEHKYKLVNIEYDIPEYFTFNYDAICRERNILIPENLKACIKGLAKKDKLEYMSKVSYKKHDTNEEIIVYFTSPVTENKVWKIEYKNDLNIKLGDSKSFQYQREERRRTFWYNVITKYGDPNVEPNKWVLDVNDEHSLNLTAGFGTLVLSNPKQNAFDILESVKQARRKFKYTKYTF